jgi:multidrug efflux pump subunit AcrA (membrane-fusion protein)
MLRVLIFSLKTIIPLAILAGGFLLAKYLLATGPEPEKRPPADRTPVVEVQAVKAQDYTVNIDASGIVKARTQSSLVSEVAGRIVEISPEFRPGAYIEKGQLLLALDDSNYVDAIRIAKSNIAANEAALAQLNQEERNTLISLKLARENLLTVRKNLNLAQRNINNVKRKAQPLQKNTGLIQQNIQLAQQNMALTNKNLELGKRNLGLAQKELNRLRELIKRRLIPVNQAEAQEQKVLQQQQQILQLEQTLVQQRQSIVQQQQQLTQQDQSLAQQDQNDLSQQQQVLQQQQAVNQQQQSVANLEGQMATFESRRNSLKANNELTRTQLLQQQRNLERTKIYAPYNGRVLEQRVDIGQYVSPNAVLGVVYSTDYVEVEIPLTLSQFALLDMPDAFAGEEIDPSRSPKATFNVPFAGQDQVWQGYVTGTRASLSEQSRQVTVVARIDNPFERSEGRTSVLKIGQYLNARVEGRTFKDVFVLPPVAVRQNKDVLQMRDNQVHIAPVDVLWTTEEAIVLTSTDDLAAAPVITTALGQATQGMKVALPGQKPQRGGPGSGRPGGERGKPPADESGDAPTLRDVKPAGEQGQLPTERKGNNRQQKPDNSADVDKED